MALTPLKLPRLLANLAIVNGQGQPTNAFLRLFNDAFSLIETNANQTAQNVLDLQAAFAAIQAVSQVAQAAQQAANVAQETADQAGGGTAVSGSSSAIINPLGAAWVNGPQVDLTGVAAGNLTIDGTGPQQDDSMSSTDNYYGQYRVVEIIGMVETVLFTGDYQVYLGNPATVLNQSAAAVAAFSSARISTGAVSYRLDANRTDGGIIVSLDLLLYLFVRRS